MSWPGWNTSAWSAASRTGGWYDTTCSRYTPHRLRGRYARGRPFVCHVLAGPKRWLVGDEPTLAAYLRGDISYVATPSGFDELRALRHASIYEPDEDEAELAAHVTEALATLCQALPAVRAWLVHERPALAAALASVHVTDRPAHG